MTGIPGIIIRTYSFLLRLYPGSFRRNFEEQMLLDFSDLAADASRRGKWGLTFFCLRELIDFPVNLLKICLEKESLNPVFRPGAGCNILRIALAFGLAFALNNFVGILAFARQSYFADFSRFAAAINWLGILQVESIVFSSSDLILGPVFVAVVLLIIFPEMRPVKRYLPGTALAFALPAILVDLWSSVLKSLDLPFKDTLFALASYILIGWGFGIIASMISRDRRKTPWLLLVGSASYFLTTWAFNILILSSYHEHHEHSVVLWRAIASLAMRNGMIGIVMGLLLGIVLEFKRRDDPPGFPSVQLDAL